MNIDIFQKYWKILKRNYNDKLHTQEDMKIYYSIFKGINETDFKEVIKEVLKKQKYFPNIAEINQFVEANENRKILKKFEGIKEERKIRTDAQERELEAIKNGTYRPEDF